MNPSEQPVSVTDKGFVIFMSRVIGLWLIVMFIAFWVMGQLPHQLTATPNAWINSPLLNQLATLLPSTLAIAFMIVPSRKLAAICLFAMIFLLLSYHGRNPALKLSVFPLIYLPFLVKTTDFRNAWKWTTRFMFLSFAFTAPFMSLSVSALPAYTLLLHAVIPWERLFVRFVERFEPK
ncbi:hypothetical protein [Sediminibacterium goheungense]|uniref:Uncharacterized protein n=1 Tax=Sediminibacterium goheungense TaxID=1086393 RepID=A0A4R6J1R5_9BACT|nr:hypothetical protein [Sediminibacterium goheungense]TDO28105.1 hypothetical protein BC659_0165 [Sediminibacterium goheungense]